MLIVGNWKAYVNSGAAAKKLFATAKRVASSKHELVLAPPAPYLALIALGARTKVRFASQDVSALAGGAHTGELTAEVVRGAGATYAIIGHSERRAEGETDEMVLRKVQNALAEKLTPIVCIGEWVRDADAAYLGFLRGQLDAVFSPLSAKDRLAVVIAYEPIWAIGKSAVDAITPTDLNEMALYIRKLLGSYIPGKGSAKTRILYGGSVDASNIRELAGVPGIDGFLIGRASAEAATFTALMKALS